MEKKILIVDDSRTMRELFGGTLKKGGFAIVHACDGKDALIQLGMHQVDVIITDLHMPNVNGLDLIRALRSHPNFKNTPLLMLTSEGTEDAKAKGMAAGATEWLVKPFNPEKLLEIVSKMCG